MRVRFIAGATDGTLTDEEFRRYLVIEEAFVVTAVRVLGLVVAESQTLDDARDHVAALSHLVTEQRDYFAELRSRFPYEGDIDALVQASSMLSDYVLGLARRHGRDAALVAMFAAEHLYLTWCTRAATIDASREPALQDWIVLHTGQTFTTQVAALAAAVDRLPAVVSDANLDSWFAGMLAAENGFHDATVFVASQV